MWKMFKFCDFTQHFHLSDVTESTRINLCEINWIRRSELMSSLRVQVVVVVVVVMYLSELPDASRYSLGWNWTMLTAAVWDLNSVIVFPWVRSHSWDRETGDTGEEIKQFPVHTMTSNLEQNKANLQLCFFSQQDYYRIHRGDPDVTEWIKPTDGNNRNWFLDAVLIFMPPQLCPSHSPENYFSGTLGMNFCQRSKVNVTSRNTAARLVGEGIQLWGSNSTSLK